ncbi:hypothetical protein LCGC14_2056910 [marine sediment metagenome]|uniref:Uncharacterized protein n=1 Tax=marine sediment metagenome TaxID=412755 RepID=A0A0F9EMA4_9ZZZZ
MPRRPGRQRALISREAKFQADLMHSALKNGQCRAAYVRLMNAATANEGVMLPMSVTQKFYDRCARKKR